MKILHYALGFPPYRTGGLTKYVIDLMNEQVKLENDVLLLWPGKIKITNNNINIKHRKNVGLINSYELINPLPIPLLNGIKNTELYIKPINKKVYIDFLEQIKPNVIHVHTLMGLHKEFFEAAKELKIKIVYTTHDYFGICPKVNLMCDKEKCTTVLKCNKCEKCNRTAFSYKKIIIMQSHVYKKIKNFKLINIIKEKYKQKENKNIDVVIENSNTSEDKKYIELQQYYKTIFSLIDKIHFNSNIAKEIFEKYVPIKEGKVISITHGNIKDNKKIKRYNELRKITYLGSVSDYKGYYLLTKALDLIQNENFKLNIYGKPPEKKDYIIAHSKYNYNQIEKIMDNTDVLVVPSIWNETFGFNVIEALSYGVPCIVTENVGAKDLIENKKSGFIVNDNVEDIRNIMTNLIEKKNLLEEMNKYIVLNVQIEEIEQHTKKILEFYEV